MVDMKHKRVYKGARIYSNTNEDDKETVDMMVDMDYYCKKLHNDIMNQWVYDNPGIIINTNTNTKPVSSINIKATEKKIKEMIEDNKGAH